MKTGVTASQTVDPWQ